MGKVWNESQDHLDNMVRQGDELLWVSALGTSDQLEGQDAANALRRAWARARTAHESGLRSEVELVFRALRPVRPLKVEEEIETLKRSGCEVVAKTATVQNLRKIIAASDCQALHISLHCSVSQDNLLILEGAHGKAHVLRAGEFQQLLAQGPRQQAISLVFLNACHSLTLGSYLAEVGVKHIVCVRDEDDVRDESCRLFARDFWSALRTGRTVKEAFDCGVAVLASSEEQHLRRDALKFVLLPKEHDHSDAFVPAVGACLLPRPQPCGSGKSASALPLVEDYLGREVDVHRLLLLVQSRRFVEVQGEPGIGKTTLLAEACRFLLPRQDYFDEVHWIDGGSDQILKGERVQQLDALRRSAPNLGQRRALFIVDNSESIDWDPFQNFLRFDGAHIVHAIMGDAAQAAKDQPSACVAMKAGLKPVFFELGQLDPVLRVQLFLRRAPRPVYQHEVHCGEALPIANRSVVVPPQRPSELIRLADARLFSELGGNPRRIVEAAMRLNSRSFSGRSPKCFSTSSRLSEASQLGGATESVGITWCKVRLIRPDGTTRDEWLSSTLTIGEVLHEYCPCSLSGAADIYISGCRTPRDAKLSDFSGPLLLEFRAQRGDCW